MAEEDAAAGEGEAAVPAGADVQPLAGGVTLEELNIEVDLLALASARSILATVAQRIKALAPTLVVIGDETLPTAARAFREYQDRVKLLEGELTSLLARQSSEAGEPEFPTAGIAAAGSAVAGIASLFSYFRTETAYFGKKVDLKATALYPMLAGALVKLEIPTTLPGLLPMPSSSADARSYSVLGALDKLLKLRDEVRAKYLEGAPTEAAALLATADAFIESVAKVDAETGVSILSELLKGAAIHQLTNRHDRPLLVILNSITAGGHYKTRKHLFTTLFTGDRLSYSGGAAIGYVVVDLKTSNLLSGDVIMQIKQEMSPHRGIQHLLEGK